MLLCLQSPRAATAAAETTGKFSSPPEQSSCVRHEAGHQTKVLKQFNISGFSPSNEAALLKPQHTSSIPRGRNSVWGVRFAAEQATGSGFAWHVSEAHPRPRGPRFQPLRRLLEERKPTAQMSAPRRLQNPSQKYFLPPV